jgi:hypothetical protein
MSVVVTVTIPFTYFRLSKRHTVTVFKHFLNHLEKFKTYKVHSNVIRHSLSHCMYAKNDGFIDRSLERLERLYSCVTLLYKKILSLQRHGENSDL